MLSNFKGLSLTESPLPRTETQRHRRNAGNPALAGLEILLVNMPPDLTSSLFLNLNFSDALTLRTVNHAIAHSYTLNSIIRSPFQSRRLGGKCQVEVSWQALDNGNKECMLKSGGRSSNGSEEPCDGWSTICGNGPHNGHLTLYCESHRRRAGLFDEQCETRTRQDLFEVCEEHRGKAHTKRTLEQATLLSQIQKNICEWVPVCESCTVRYISENPYGVNSCTCEATMEEEESVLAHGWNCDSCVHITANANRRKAFRRFLEIMLDQAMPGATVEEMQAVLMKASKKVAIECWGSKFGLGDWFTCPICREVCAGSPKALKSVPQVELCLVCEGVFYAVPESKEMRERSLWLFNLILPV